MKSEQETGSKSFFFYLLQVTIFFIICPIVKKLMNLGVHFLVACLRAYTFQGSFVKKKNASMLLKTDIITCIHYFLFICQCSTCYKRITIPATSWKFFLNVSEDKLNVHIFFYLAALYILKETIIYIQSLQQYEKNFSMYLRTCQHIFFYLTALYILKQTIIIMQKKKQK